MENKIEYPKAEFEEVAFVLKVIAHPVRLQIICLLGRYGRLNVNSFRTQLPLSQPVVSQHLIKLLDRDILKRSREGREFYYYLSNPHLITVLDIVFHNNSTWSTKYV